MKKLTLFFMTLLLFNVSFAKEKIDTTFTFRDFSPTSASIVRVTPKTKIENKSRISYPVFAGRNSTVTKNMNTNVTRFISDYKSTKHISYNVSYDVTANNSSFVSILFTIELTDNDTGQKAKLHNAMTFNLKNGKVLQLKDLFADGFESSLSSAINNKFKQFGLPQVDKFDAIVKQQNFYMENDSIIFIYNKGEASNFADGEVFIPFLLTDLIGILK